MTREQLMSAKAPFRITDKKGKYCGTVIGFSQNDPLGVGGGIMPDMPTCYFEGGGWLLVEDLLRNHELEHPSASFMQEWVDGEELTNAKNLFRAILADPAVTFLERGLVERIKELVGETEE